MEKSTIIDNLTSEQEEKLQKAHSKNYMGTDDDMPEAFDSWLVDVSLEEIKKILNE